MGLKVGRPVKTAYGNSDSHEDLLDHIKPSIISIAALTAEYGVSHTRRGCDNSERSILKDG